MLSPGASQVYYGDEIARALVVENAVGDANLRSAIDWNQLSNKQDILTHWQKLGQFRNNHPAVGAGKHEMLSQGDAYIFSRTYTKGNYQDAVVVALDIPEVNKKLDVSTVFSNGQKLHDFYSDESFEVKEGSITIQGPKSVVLLERQ